MNQQDKPFWGPVAALLASFRMHFCGWPAELRHISIPGAGSMRILVPVGAVRARPTLVREERLISANDDAFFPPPGVA